VTAEVTIVVPTKDRVRVLRQCLVSLLAQDGVDLRVVVVDDGSVIDDVTRAAAAFDDPRVVVLRNDVSVGPSAARNRGISAASTPWVAFCDDDDVWAPDKLALQLKTMGAEPSARWSCCGSLTVDSQLVIVGHRRAPASGDLLSALLAFNVVPGGGSSVLAARDLVVGAGGFDDAMDRAEDWDLWIRLAQRSPVATVDRPLVAHRVWGRSESLDTVGMARGHALVAERYGELARERGVSFDELGIEQWFAKQHLRAGRRRAALRSFAAIARREGPITWARALVAFAAPDLVHRLGDARSRRDVPADWHADGTRWLQAIVRETERTTPVLS